MITALVNLYDEGREMAYGLVETLVGLGVRRMVVVEGPYALYPHRTRLHDGYAERAMLYEAAVVFGSMDLVSDSRRSWDGNEVEKRQRALEIGLALSGPDDWLLVWDADFRAVDPVDLREFIGETGPYRYVDFMISTEGAEERWRNRPLLKAVPGMRYVANHHSIRYPDGEVISTGLVEPYMALGKALCTTEILHVRQSRPTERLERQQAYYDVRDRLKVEG
jgi:hypothetical protein